METIADAVEGALKAEGYRALHREGVAESGWVLLDFGDVVVHVFLPDTRAFYALDRPVGRRAGAAHRGREGRALDTPESACYRDLRAGAR